EGIRVAGSEVAAAAEDRRAQLTVGLEFLHECEMRSVANLQLALCHHPGRNAGIEALEEELVVHDAADRRMDEGSRIEAGARASAGRRAIRCPQLRLELRIESREAQQAVEHR